jgi:hypothetical protein
MASADDPEKNADGDAEEIQEAADSDAAVSYQGI